MNKKIVFLLLLILTISTVAFGVDYEYENLETGYKLIINDEALRLGPMQNGDNPNFTNLAEVMKPLTQYGNIVYYTTNTFNYNSNKTAHDYYYGLFGTQSGTVFLDNVSIREIYIYSDGNNLRTITSGRASSITDNVYVYAKNGEYYECAKEAFSQMLVLLEGGKIAEPMRIISNIMISIIIAFLGTFIFVMKKSALKGPKISSVIDNCNIKFLINSTSARKTGERRVYSPQSSDSGGYSSGGGGGHSSHSSHSSGGGGGHGY